MSKDVMIVQAQRLSGNVGDVLAKTENGVKWQAPLSAVDQSLYDRLSVLESLSLGRLTVSYASGTAPADAGWKAGQTMAWKAFGHTESLVPGTYEVSFKPVEGYTAPESQSVTLAAGDDASVSAVYTEIQSSEEPQEQLAAYTVSDASIDAANGDYSLYSEGTGRNGTSVYSNGTYYMHLRLCDDRLAWVLAASVNSSQSGPPAGMYCESSDTDPPTSGWAGCTVSAN